ncbi:hypothetical protein LIER_29273 [Lithospermum erythrorhizon]|uniref:Uncharacterized protein n=1 Tax=Lithospermum erythrorhizon TaxID=34254 RepID=A0AAV3RJ24_LITER
MIVSFLQKFKRKRNEEAHDVGWFEDLVFRHKKSKSHGGDEALGNIGLDYVDNVHGLVGSDSYGKLRHNNNKGFEDKDLTKGNTPSGLCEYEPGARIPESQIQKEIPEKSQYYLSRGKKDAPFLVRERALPSWIIFSLALTSVQIWLGLELEHMDGLAYEIV